jgi:hypothetical protein
MLCDKALATPFVVEKQFGKNLLSLLGLLLLHSTGLCLGISLHLLNLETGNICITIIYT